LDKALELAAGSGYRGVEIWGRPPHTPEVFDQAYWQKVRERLDAFSLEISMFGSYVNPSWQDYDDKLSSALRICGLLGARIMRVWAGSAEPKDASEELWKHVTKAYREMSKKAADHGLTLAIEMHRGTLCVSPEGSLRLLEQVGASNLRLNYQIADPANPDIEGDVAKVGQYIVNIHAQNYLPSVDGDGRYELCLIEEGVIDYRRLLELLEPYGFDGYIEAEFLKGEHTSEKAMLESLKRDAEYLLEITRPSS